MPLSDRLICVHGHFYQPPRENPWLERIEVQDAAYPFHDWNERITAECYGPNATSRILDDEGFISRIVNNYASISFNFGPTLLSWLEANAPRVYGALIEADRLGRHRFSGHGTALAQAYNHMIMPLANGRDKRTQVKWGIEDFRHRFQREPEGMWLPETAVDLDSLEALAEQNIRFTILAPRQASRVRPLSGGDWEDVSGEQVDPTRPYVLRLPSGRTIVLFFYDGAISKAVAFEGLLHSGRGFARRLAEGSREERDGPQLVHIATDGETYGHHHRHGDMALASAIAHIEDAEDVQLTVYGEFLEHCPPEYEVEILEDSSWSCIHGVERWRSDCGCNSGAHAGWDQAWRGPLREALDWLRDEMAREFETEGTELFRDPWAARDAYVDVILDRSAQSVERFLETHGLGLVGAAQKTRSLRLMELQRHAMLMYTSCGWFFDDISGIETVQAVEYAARALQLGEELFGNGYEEAFVRLLAPARSNLRACGNGAEVYQNIVQRRRLGLEEVGGHYAIASLFDGQREDATDLFAYRVVPSWHLSRDLGRAKLVTGHAEITSKITWESMEVAYGAIFPGDHNVSGGVREFPGVPVLERLTQEATQAFDSGDFPEVVRVLDEHLYGCSFSIRSLFDDEQRRILNEILAPMLEEAEAAYASLYEREAPIMRFLSSIGLPLPRALRIAAELYIDANVRHVLEAEARSVDAERLRSLLQDADALSIALDREGLGYEFSSTLAEFMTLLEEQPRDPDLLRAAAEVAELALAGGLILDLRDVQNTFYHLAKDVSPSVQARAAAGDAEANDWIARFSELGRHLSVRAD